MATEENREESLGEMLDQWHAARQAQMAYAIRSGGMVAAGREGLPFPTTGLSAAEKAEAQVELVKVLADLERVSGDVTIEESTRRREDRRLISDLIAAQKAITQSEKTAQGKILAAEIDKDVAVMKGLERDMASGGSAFVPRAASDLSEQDLRRVAELSQYIEPDPERPGEVRVDPGTAPQFVSELTAAMNQTDAAKRPLVLHQFSLRNPGVNLGTLLPEAGATQAALRRFEELEKQGLAAVKKLEAEETKAKADWQRLADKNVRLVGGGDPRITSLLDKYIAGEPLTPTEAAEVKQSALQGVPVDPTESSKEQVRALLDSLESGSPLPEARRLQKKIMEDPRFTVYKEQRNFESDDEAFKMMIREAKVQEKNAAARDKRSMRAARRSGQWAGEEFSALMDAPRDEFAQTAPPPPGAAGAALTEGSGRDTGSGTGTTPEAVAGAAADADAVPEPTVAGEVETPAEEPLAAETVEERAIEATEEEREATRARVDAEVRDVSEALGERYETIWGQQLARDFGYTPREERQAMRQADRALRRATRAERAEEAERRGFLMPSEDVRRASQVGETERGDLAALIPDPEPREEGWRPSGPSPTWVYDKYRESLRGGGVRRPEEDLTRSEDADLAADEALRAQQESLHRELAAERERLQQEREDALSEAEAQP